MQAGEANLSRYKVLFVPPLYSASDEVLRQIADYVKNGGRVVMAFKSGFTDQYSTVRHVMAPGPLRAAAGFHYQEFTNLAQPEQFAPDPYGAGDQNKGAVWEEFIVPETAQEPPKAAAPPQPAAVAPEPPARRAPVERTPVAEAPEAATADARVQKSGESVRVPPERLHVLQLNDSPADYDADLMGKSMHRLLPGEGDVDTFAVLDVIGELGAEPVVATEVFSLELAALEPAENAQRQFDAARSLLARYRELKTVTPST